MTKAGSLDYVASSTSTRGNLSHNGVENIDEDIHSIKAL